MTNSLLFLILIVLALLPLVAVWVILSAWRNVVRAIFKARSQSTRSARPTLGSSPNALTISELLSISKTVGRMR